MACQSVGDILCLKLEKLYAMSIYIYHIYLHIMTLRPKL